METDSDFMLANIAVCFPDQIPYLESDSLVSSCVAFAQHVSGTVYSGCLYGGGSSSFEGVLRF